MEFLLQAIAIFFLGFFVYLGCQLYVVLFEGVMGLIFIVIEGLYNLVVATVRRMRKEDKPPAC